MRHDVCHCFDYIQSMCPENCYRAQVTQDLKDNIQKFEGIPTSFAHFKGTPNCPKWPKEERK